MPYGSTEPDSACYKNTPTHQQLWDYLLCVVCFLFLRFFFQFSSCRPPARDLLEVSRRTRVKSGLTSLEVGWMRRLGPIGEAFALPIYAGWIDLHAGRWKIVGKISDLLETRKWQSNAKKIFFGLVCHICWSCSQGVSIHAEEGEGEERGRGVPLEVA